MKAWISSVLLVTFLAGGGTGYLIGNTTPPETRTWIDEYIDRLELCGVKKPADRELAREIYEEYEGRILSLRKEVERAFSENIAAFRLYAEKRLEREVLAPNDLTLQDLQKRK